MQKKNNLRKKPIIEERMGGLLPTPDDERDFSLGGVFGVIDIKQVPIGDWVVSEPLEIKDQRRSDMCTGYSLAAVSEDQEGVPLDPGFAFAMIKRERGEVNQYGASLRDGVKVAVNTGLIKVGDNPDDFSNEDRNFIANWRNWNLGVLLPKAEEHKKASYFKVDGPYDTFDNIRAALWQHRAEKRSVYTGCIWQNTWSNSEGGVISKKPGAGSFGHAFKVFGVKYFKGEPYLMVQNSYGTDVGDNGIFYFPRNIVNAYFTFGAYMFKDMPLDVAKNLNEQAVAQGWSDFEPKRNLLKEVIDVFRWLFKKPRITE